jgi:excisionase family DNA binding protein
MPIESQEKRFLTVKEFCAMARIGRTTFYRLMKAGTIPHTRLGNRILIASEVINEMAEKAGEKS